MTILRAYRNEASNCDSPSPPNPLSLGERGLGGEGECVIPHRARYILPFNWPSFFRVYSVRD
jgi:hypothetical protein